MKSCEFCTGWTDDFKRDKSRKACTDYLGKPICVECGAHLLRVMRKGLTNRLKEIKKDMGDRVTIYTGDKELL